MPERIKVCAPDELNDGEHRVVEAGAGIDVAVFRIDGSYHAIEDVCTHDYNPLADGEVDGHCIICPRHGARFDLRTGKALSLPAYRPVETFDVEVDDTGVWVLVD